MLRCQQTIGHFRALNQVGAVLRGSLDMDAALPLICDQIAEGLQLSRVLVLLLQESPRRLVVLSASGERHEPDRARSITLAEGSPLARALQQGEILQMPGHVLETIVGADGGALLCAPLIARDRAVGLLVGVDAQRQFQAEEEDFLETVANFLAFALDRSRLLQEVQASESRFRQVLNQAPVGISVARAERLVYVNPALAQMFGFERADELIGTSIWERTHPDFREQVAKRVKRAAVLGEKIPKAEEAFIRKDGTLMFAEVAALPVQFEGEPAVIAAFRDVTEKRQAQDALNKALRANETIFSAMRDGLLWVDGKGHIQKANRSAGRLLNQSPEKLIGNVWWELLALPGPDVLKAANSHLTLSVGPSSVRLEREASDQGDLISLRDVTQEEAVNRLKSEFVSMASHELRTPAAIIKGYVDLLVLADDWGLSEEKRRQMFVSIQKQTNHLTRLINDLLNVSRLEEGRVPVNRQTVQLENLARLAVESLAHLASSKGMELRLTVPQEPLPAISADPEHVTQILTNLLDNAIKYSPPGRPVEVALSALPKGIRLTVADHGIGIPTQEMARVFEKFHRIPTPFTTLERGTGLGLYITRQLVDLQGGMIFACSQAGVGSTFAVIFPVAN